MSAPSDHGHLRSHQVHRSSPGGGLPHQWQVSSEEAGDEYCDEYSWSIGAEDAMGGEFGGGPWSGEDPGAYGGAD